MVLAACRLAGGVAVALRDALIAPFLADEVGQREAVLRDVRLLVVAAEAAVCERGLASRVSGHPEEPRCLLSTTHRIALVYERRARLHLFADERACGLFV